MTAATLVPATAPAGLLDPDTAAFERSLELGAIGSFGEKAAFVATQALRLAFGPTPMKTQCAVRIANVLEVRLLPGKLARMQETEEGRAVLADRPRVTWADVRRLSDLPADTFGGAYARFAIAHDLNPDFVAAPRHVHPDLAYTFTRGAQTHDFWHLVCDTDTSNAGEAVIIAFMLAQQPSLFMAVLGGAAAMAGVVQDPRVLPTIVRAFRQGRRARDLMPVYWERMWAWPLDDVRAALGIEVSASPVSLGT